MSLTQNAFASMTTPNRPLRLLVVDDDIAAAFAVREFFTLSGYFVDCAATLRDTSVLLEQHSYDAVVTDLHLSRMQCAEGMLVAEHARRRNPNACIVMLSPSESETMANEAHRKGADVFRIKPMDVVRLGAFFAAARETRDASPRSERRSPWER